MAHRVRRVETIENLEQLLSWSDDLLVLTRPAQENLMALIGTSQQWTHVYLGHTVYMLGREWDAVGGLLLGLRPGVSLAETK